ALGLLPRSRRELDRDFVIRGWQGLRRISLRRASAPVIPGWSKGPDPESRDSGFSPVGLPRNDEREKCFVAMMALNTNRTRRGGTPAAIADRACLPSSP